MSRSPAPVFCGVDSDASPPAMRRLLCGHSPNGKEGKGWVMEGVMTKGMQQSNPTTRSDKDPSMRVASRPR